MTKPLSFTEHSIARLVRGLERAGKHVVAVKPDGTLLISSEPLDPASLAIKDAHNDRPSKWEDQHP